MQMIVSFSEVGKSVMYEVPCNTLLLNLSSQAMCATLRKSLVNIDL